MVVEVLGRALCSQVWDRPVDQEETEDPRRDLSYQIINMKMNLCLENREVQDLASQSSNRMSSSSLSLIVRTISYDS